MLSKSILSGVISRTLIAILTELFGAPDARLHLRELERRTGLGLAGLRRTLNDLVEKEIVIAERSGNRVYFSANPDCPIYPELKMLVAKTTGIAEQVRRALEPLSERIMLSYIYGSIADGSADARSDVDLMVVGDISLIDLVGPLEKASKAISREINPSTYKPKEYRAELGKKGSFINSVHSGQRIMLHGHTDEPRRERKGKKA